MKKLIIIIAIFLAGCTGSNFATRQSYDAFSNTCDNKSFTYISTTDGEYNYFSAKCKVFK